MAIYIHHAVDMDGKTVFHGCMEYRGTLCFIADSTLGKLAKWLRLLGFDTKYDSRRPDARRLSTTQPAERVILTRSKAVADMLSGRRVLFIKSNCPNEQMLQLIDELHLTVDQTRVFSRCSVCNTLLCEMEKTEVEGLVPDYVYQTQAVFKRCAYCQRIYWPGSHSRRWTALNAKWFGHK